ncbi:hypothetical protein BH09VER1_BH09VER1_40070 [soil metagenome]
MKITPYLVALSVSITLSNLRAQTPASTPSPSPAASAPPAAPAVTLPHQPPDVPAVKLGKDGQPVPGFLQRHQLLVDTAKKGNIDLYFLGDSITQGWLKVPALWEKAFGPWKPGNFGIGGDRTQHVLWRLENGELADLKPKVVVLMIGTNNSGADKPEDTARGVTKIVSTLREKLPQTKILLLAIFPRGQDANNAQRKTNDQVNAIISKLADDKHVFYLDIGPKFLQPDGTLSKDIMPDLLHPNAKGYEIWVDSMNPKLTELMQ